MTTKSKRVNLETIENMVPNLNDAVMFTPRQMNNERISSVSYLRVCCIGYRDSNLEGGGLLGLREGGGISCHCSGFFPDRTDSLLGLQRRTKTKQREK